MLGPTGLILGSTQLERSLGKGISREGKLIHNASSIRYTYNLKVDESSNRAYGEGLLSRNFDLAIERSLQPPLFFPPTVLKYSFFPS